jgi:putative ABC transport system ATP-binding protein
MEAKILRARRAFAESLPAELAGAVEFYDESRYNAAASLQDNILFGRLVYGQAQAAATIGQAIREVLDALDLRSAVLQVGLDFNVGIAGKRLSSGQRQKVALARALLKRPDLLIVNEATAVLDAAAQSRILAAVLQARAGHGVVWVLGRPEPAHKFDRVIVIKDGKIVEQGKPEDLDPAAE